MIYCECGAMRSVDQNRNLLITREDIDAFTKRINEPIELTNP